MRIDAGGHAYTPAALPNEAKLCEKFDSEGNWLISLLAMFRMDLAMPSRGPAIRPLFLADGFSAWRVDADTLVAHHMNGANSS